MHTEEFRFRASDTPVDVSAILLRPPSARALIVLGHGAGAGMLHPFMDGITRLLACHDVATLRYQFPYMEAGRSRPDPRPVLLGTVRAAAAAANERSELPLFAGGKSMGGRMTSLAAAQEPLPGVRGLVFVGFPLHPARKPGVERGAHLADVTVPMLFVQGTRDALADLPLLEPLCAKLGSSATLHIIEGADHGFHVPKRSGGTDQDVLEELATTIAAWTKESGESGEKGQALRGRESGRERTGT